MTIVWIYSKRTKRSKRIRTHLHKMEGFPNWSEMIEFCKLDDVRASDFSSKPMNGDRKKWVGKAIVDSGSKSITGGQRYMERFYVFMDHEPTYEEVAR